jgi:hypothetical protein
MVGPQVVRVFSRCKSYLKRYESIECLILCHVFGALLSGIFPHLKRQVRIVFFFSLLIFEGFFVVSIMLSLVFG